MQKANSKKKETKDGSGIIKTKNFTYRYNSALYDRLPINDRKIVDRIIKILNGKTIETGKEILDTVRERIYLTSKIS